MPNTPDTRAALNASELTAAKNAFEDHYKASAEDPAMRADLAIWLDAWATSKSNVDRGTDGSALSRIATKLREAGARLPAPQATGTVEGAVVTGLSIALALVEAEAQTPAVDGAMSASEAVYAFAAWMTCLPEPIPVGAAAAESPVAALVERFCRAQGFEAPRQDYHTRIRSTAVQPGGAA